jgi:transcription elongation factor Elf1
VTITIDVPLTCPACGRETWAAVRAASAGLVPQMVVTCSECRARLVVEATYTVAVTLEGGK